MSKKIITQNLTQIFAEAFLGIPDIEVKWTSPNNIKLINNKPSDSVFDNIDVTLEVAENSSKIMFTYYSKPIKAFEYIGDRNNGRCDFYSNVIPNYFEVENDDKNNPYNKNELMTSFINALLNEKAKHKDIFGYTIPTSYLIQAILLGILQITSQKIIDTVSNSNGLSFEITDPFSDKLVERVGGYIELEKNYKETSQTLSNIISTFSQYNASKQIGAIIGFDVEWELNVSEEVKYYIYKMYNKGSFLTTETIDSFENDENVLKLYISEKSGNIDIDEVKAKLNKILAEKKSKEVKEEEIVKEPVIDDSPAGEVLGQMNKIEKAKKSKVASYVEFIKDFHKAMGNVKTDEEVD